ncbi:uncharacterized protein [Channa argus]|uniref:uncharacterized protein n=1 Tax=Channa argus TaxID=215402 RepID=UPI0035222821
MEKLFAVLFLSALIGNTLEDDITAIRTEVVSSEGHSVTLSCKYSVKAQNLQWYRQDPGSAVQYLLLITDTKEPEVIEAKPPNPRLTAQLNQERNQVDLQISSAAVSDSAVYYCAGNNKPCFTAKPSFTGPKRKLTDAGKVSITGQKSIDEVDRAQYTFSDTVFTMLSLHCLLSIQFLSILTGVSCDKLTPIKNEEFSLEGSNITLTYTYSKAAVYNHYFFWYRQYPGKPPQFLISHSGTEPNKTAKDSTLSVKMSEDKTQVDLQISSAAVSDSAVYYCAVRPTVTGNNTTLYKNTS